MIRSRTAFVFLLVCGLVVLGSVSGQQTDASRPGWISDESCGTQHTKPGRADCVQKCWRGGASVGHPEWKPQRAERHETANEQENKNNPPPDHPFPPLPPPRMLGVFSPSMRRVYFRNSRLFILRSNTRGIFIKMTAR